MALDLGLDLMARTNKRGWHERSQWTRIEGTDCHFVTVGDRRKPVVMLLHGIAVSSWAWRFNLEALARDFYVIAPCHRGFGWSGRPRRGFAVSDLARFVWTLRARLDIERLSLVGNSLGGAVSLELAQRYPDAVEKLLLVNAVGLKRQRPWRLLHTQQRPLGLLYRAAVNRTMMRAALATFAYRNLKVDSTYMAGFWPNFRRRGSMRALLGVARELPASVAAIEGRLDTVRCPTLVCWGAGDGILPLNGGRALHTQLPGSRFVTFEASGHCPHEEEPDRFNALAREFLSG